MSEAMKLVRRLWRLAFGRRCQVGSAYGRWGMCGRLVEYRQKHECETIDNDWTYYCERHTGWPMWDVTGEVSGVSEIIVETLDGEDVTDQFRPPDYYLEEHAKKERGEPNSFNEMNKHEIWKYRGVARR